MFRRKFIRLGSALLMILALTLPVASIEVPSALAQTATSIAPLTGGTGGGRTVTLTGTGFQTLLGVADLNSVCFGATAAGIGAGTCAAAGGTLGSVPVVSSVTTATTVTPPHLAGALNVAVHFATAVPAPGWVDVGGSVATDFTYVSPSATSIIPASGPAGSGTATTIGGTNLEGTTAVLFGATSAGAPGGLATPFTSMTSTSPAALVAGAYSIGIVNAIETITTTVTFTVGAGPTATTVPPTVTGGSTLSGVVVGTAPAGTRSLAVPASAPTGSHRVPAANVVLVNQTNGAVFATRTTGTAGGPYTASDGAFSFLGIPQGTYRLSVADNDDEGSPLFPLIGGQTGCAPTAGVACGHLILQQLITVGVGGAVTPSITTLVLLAKPVPGALPTGSTVGIFGEARDATTGNPIVGAVVTATGTGTGSTTTGADGRYSIGIVGAAGLTTVSITSAAGSCTAGGINLCTDSITTVAGWNDPAFLLVGAAALATPAVNSLGTGVLQGIIPMIFRDTDTSRTGGIDVETDTIRILNGGNQRTVACVDFFGSDADGRRTTQQRQCLDLNPQSAGILSGDIVPSGIMGFAEVYSVDLDGGPAGPCPGTTLVGTATPTATTGGVIAPGCLYGVSDIHAVITHRVAEADNALAVTNGFTCEDVMGTVAACGINAAGLGVTQQTTLTINQNMIIPAVVKNFSGTNDKSDTIVQACQASGVPATQPVVFEFWSTNGGGAGSPGYANPYLYNRTADPGGCVTFNLRDLDFLDSGAYALNVTSTGLLGPSLVSGGLTGTNRPNTFTLASIQYSRTGKMATAQNGAAPATGGATTSSTGLTGCPSGSGFSGICASKVYIPLIMADYVTGGGSWWSTLAIGNFPSTATGGSTAVTLTVIDEAGVTKGVVNDRPGGDSTTVFWLGAQPGTENRGVWLRGRLIIPLDRNFRGAAILDAADVTGTLNSGSRRPVVQVNTVNYARHAMSSYSGVREEALNPTQFGLAAQANDTRPCTMLINSQLNSPPGAGNPAPIGSTCLWAPEVKGAVPQVVRAGEATGVRLFNPTGNVETVDIVYFDAVGIEWADSRTTFSIGPFSTATIFTGTDFRLPPNFAGSIYIMASCTAGGGATCAAPVAGMAQIVDYSTTSRDTTRAYNLPAQSGFTQ